MLYETTMLKPHPVNQKLYGAETIPQDFIDSIKENGILEPLVIKRDGTIISGHRRWLTAKALNMESVPVRVLEFENELDEREAIITFNKQREKTFSQKMAEAEELEAIERERARERQREAGVANLPTVSSGNVSLTHEDKGQTRDKVAEAVGLGSGRTYDKAAKVWEAAKEGNEVALELVEKLDKGEVSIHKAYKDIRRQELRKEKQEELQTRELPTGVFEVILADPPWRYQFSETQSREIENHYPTMDLDDIKNLNVPSADDSVLFLWATAPKLEEALEVLNSWGFTYKTCAVWDKEKIGMGYWFRGQHELLLVGTKGSFPTPEPSARFSSIIKEPRSTHSTKPKVIYEMLEAMFPGRTYLELFCRTPRDGWEVWGNEV
jgi:N6-adenosine-specific RNA methylase IME4/ParB-like chromosome segregation protein Spo0J